MSDPFFYDLPTDKVTGTWSSDGMVNSLYPLTNIDDDKPWNPVKFTSNPTYLLFDKGSAKRTDTVASIHVNWDAGAVVHVEENDSNVWTSPTISETFTMAGATEDGQPSNPFSDRTLLGGYTTSGLRYLRFHIVSGQSTLLSIGLIRVSSHHRVLTDASTSDRDRDYGAVDRELHPAIKRTTDAGVQLGYSRGTRARMATGSIRSDATGFPAYQTWVRASRGGFKPFLYVPDPAFNEAWFAFHGPASEMAFQRTWTDFDVFDCPINIEELGRGLAP